MDCCECASIFTQYQHHENYVFCIERKNGKKIATMNTVYSEITWIERTQFKWNGNALMPYSYRSKYWPRTLIKST